MQNNILLNESLQKFLLALTQHNFSLGMWGENSWGKTGKTATEE